MDNMKWIPVTEQKLPTKTGNYFVTICDDTLPNDAYFNQIQRWWFDGDTGAWGFEAWENKEIANRVIAWCREIPYVLPSQEFNGEFGFN